MFKRHSIAWFYIFVLVFSWYPWILALARGTTTGPNPLGVFLAAILILALTEGRKGVVDLLRRIIRWRVNGKWYATVLLMPAAIAFSAAALTWLLGAKLPSFEMWQKWRELPERFLFIFLFIGLGEEPGWRGYALVQLQKRRSALAASLILAPLWAFWHLPLIGSEFTMPMVAPFLISLFAATIIGTWIYNRTNGSVLIQMLFHASVNTTGAGYFYPMFDGTYQAGIRWISSLIWLLVALLVWKIAAIEKEQVPERATILAPA